MVDFSMLFGKSDPDLVIGHEVIASTLEVIFKRMSDLMIDCGYFGRLK